MLRAVAKGVLLAGFGWMPGGPNVYQMVTRDWMGTQATHVDKLMRVWPDYATVWSSVAGIDLDGSDVWVHEGGWTPFPFFANHLLTGRGGFVTNRHSRMLDRYLARAVNGSLACDLPQTPAVAQRKLDIEALRWSNQVADAIAAVGGRLEEQVQVDHVPLESASVDLCHSGGTLEHMTPEDLRTFLVEAHRVLRSGAVMSHVFDHRDHLHHADPSWPYLQHLRMSPGAYRVFCGHELLYHNRLLPDRVMELFEEAGFEQIAVRRMILPDRVYVDSDEATLRGDPGIDRADLAPRFREASDADLRTAAAHYLYRKA